MTSRTQSGDPAQSSVHGDSRSSEEINHFDDEVTQPKLLAVSPSPLKRKHARLSRCETPKRKTRRNYDGLCDAPKKAFVSDPRVEAKLWNAPRLPEKLLDSEETTYRIRPRVTSCGFARELEERLVLPLVEARHCFYPAPMMDDAAVYHSLRTTTGCELL